MFYVLLWDRWNLRGPSLELIDGSVAFTGSLGVWDVSIIGHFPIAFFPFYLYGLSVGEDDMVPAGLTLTGGAFGMHASGPGG